MHATFFVSAVSIPVNNIGAIDQGTYRPSCGYALQDVVYRPHRQGLSMAMANDHEQGASNFPFLTITTPPRLWRLKGGLYAVRTGDTRMTREHTHSVHGNAIH